jgi:SAM-dependent methyltransferase
MNGSSSDLADPPFSEPAVADAGSFRDPNGRVYLHRGEVFRGLSRSALDNFRALRETRFYGKFLQSGELVGTEEIPAPGWAAVQAEWAGWLQHQAVPFISYPYEWTFSMLRDAALLQLRLLEAALQEGWSMKDATPYNVQFVAGKPVFIDIPSFEPLPPGSAWQGYRQFCEMNLFPLLLQAYKGVDFQPFLRAGINGIDVQMADGLFSLRDRLRKGVGSHVWLQALLDRKYGNSQRNLRNELRNAGLNRELLLSNVRKLKKLLQNLEWKPVGSEWADYTAFHNYSDEDHAAKAEFVEHAVRDSEAQLVWDLGCNTGQFSAIAARHAPQVIAMDIDHLAVERLYRNAELMSGGRILPLVQNLANPSPAWGWNQAERKTLEQRGRPQLVLALALIHHVVISANIPVSEFVAWLASLGSALVIEFVDRADDKVVQLLRNRSEQFPDYNPQSFEQALARHFTIVRQQDLREGLRTLYFCQPGIA